MINTSADGQGAEEPPAAPCEAALADAGGRTTGVGGRDRRPRSVRPSNGNGPAYALDRDTSRAADTGPG